MILDLGQVFISVLNSMNSKSDDLRNYRRLLLFPCDLFQFLHYCGRFRCNVLLSY